MIEQIGRYRIEGLLGEGGMGVVYAARDERLDRPVALKVMREAIADETSRARFWREARVAASVSHPHICQTYELDEVEGRPYIAMERLEGETLAARIARGPLDPGAATGAALEMLDALGELHDRGLLHRDLKPANVFLTARGVKLVDFGLAKPMLSSTITGRGAIVGTPRYMAPEQLLGHPADARTELFAVGAILCEMLTGEPLFGGNSIAEVAYLIVHGTCSPPDTVSPAITRVLVRALAKNPDARFPDARAFANALRSGDAIDVQASETAGEPTRVIMLPLRVLRPDADTDFLAFSLPDAVGASLASVPGMVVRSSMTAARFGADTPDLRAVAREAAVDVVVTGTLMRAGDQVRVSVQAVHAASAKLVHTRTVQSTMGDLFALQDDLARRLVESLVERWTTSPQIETSQTALQRDRPRDPEAYALFLRGNERMMDSAHWQEALALYRASLEKDPAYAPAWARLGRVYRVMGKYGDAGPAALYRLAQEAFAHAFATSPDLPMAHHYGTYLDVETGHARAAMVRLLGRMRSHAPDAELLSALVVACRYCGLLNASLVADAAARRLDPNALSSVAYTHLLLGHLERAVAAETGDQGWVRAYVLQEQGRLDEARAVYRRLETESPHALVRRTGRFARLGLDGDPSSLREMMAAIDEHHHGDPEAMFLRARSFAFAGMRDEVFVLLRLSLDQGYCAPTVMRTARAFDRLRGEREFVELLAKADAERERSREAFLAAGGESVLGPGVTED